MIDTQHLPIVLQSLDPTKEWNIITCLQTEDKQQIVDELECECGIRGASADLAIQAQQNQKATTIPKEYQQFASVFSEEESQRFPPSCP